MKAHIESLLNAAIAGLQAEGGLPQDAAVQVEIEHTRSKEHGDFACNVALALAKAAKAKPRELAGRIVKALPASPLVAKVEIAGPGFINFFLKQNAYQQVIAQILDAGAGYGRSTLGAGKRVQVEFVSANPTGPLHVGHGRGAAYGAAVADLLAATGFSVHREYYVNDAGRQMDILATSVWLRYLEL
ncbi:MAG TPA: arginine--tRNA ligase, partial [Acidiferrobacterales bacterium]|nr:arginine--tRNA ligase [Acidiferrobacterales bacterium]